MKLIQDQQRAAYFTDEKLFCSVCNKQVEHVIETDGELMACLECFISNLMFIFALKDGDYFKIRMITDTLFKTRREIISRERALLTLKLRFQIFKRDDFKCVMCGKTAKESTLEADHIKPVSKGGKTSIENLQTLCFECNRGKGDEI